VIPVAYGMAFKNKKLLLVAMSAGYTAMMKASKVIDNKVELGVKVLLPPKDEHARDEMEQFRTDVLSRLEKKSAQRKELKRFSDRLVLNASFLVDREGVDNFSEEVRSLERDRPYLKFMYSGPWPPYNFVDIRILSKKGGGFR
jgi:glycosyltransferase involved in cell wall biosynthesis